MIDIVRVPMLALAIPVLTMVGCAGTSPATHEPRVQGTVTSADLDNPNVPIEVVLQRKVPGLIVTRSAGGAIALQIRGSSSFVNAGTPPLFLVNGTPYTPGPGGALTDINPHDIESIRVLTTAQSAIYGLQGAGGVIEVKTKLPGKRP